VLEAKNAFQKYEGRPASGQAYNHLARPHNRTNGWAGKRPRFAGSMQGQKFMAPLHSPSENLNPLLTQKTIHPGRANTSGFKMRSYQFH
jgi:hypothetical protein